MVSATALMDFLHDVRRFIVCDTFEQWFAETSSEELSGYQCVPCCLSDPSFFLGLWVLPLFLGM